MTTTARGLRNNNPGNIRNRDDINWKGEVKKSNKKDFSFEEFNDIVAGYRALLMQLRAYAKRHGCKTIKDYINRFAPPMENNTSGYIKRVCKIMNVGAMYVPDPDDKTIMIAMAAAISEVENGVPANMADIEKAWDDI